MEETTLSKLHHQNLENTYINQHLQGRGHIVSVALKGRTACHTNRARITEFQFHRQNCFVISSTKLSSYKIWHLLS